MNGSRAGPWIEVGHPAARHEDQSHAGPRERECEPVQGQTCCLWRLGVMVTQGSTFFSSFSRRRSERDRGTDREKIAHQ
jgi:hypothetical protein